MIPPHNTSQSTVARTALTAAALVVLMTTAHCGSTETMAAQRFFGVPARSLDQPDKPVATGSWHPTRQVIFIAIDGVRWQDVYQGADPKLVDDQAVPDELLLPPERLLPNLYRRVVARGVALGAPGHGAPMLASGPNFISLPGYMEMLSGAPSGCTRNDCDRIKTPTIVDEFRSRSSPRDHVAVFSSWEAIDRAAAMDTEGIVMSTGRHGGASRDMLREDPVTSELIDLGEAAPAFPGEYDYRPDAFTAPIALRYLVTHRPRFMFIGLGDTDEWGHRNDYQSYLQALRYCDAFIGDLLRTLDTMGEYGATTTVVITTDHGRSARFTSHGGEHAESGQVWMMAVGGSVPARGFLASDRPHRLADITPTLRVLLGFSEPSSNASIIAGMLPPDPRDQRSQLVARSSTEVR